MAAQIKCHKCGRNHKAHTATVLFFKDGKYYWTEDATNGGIIVKVGGTCFGHIWQKDLKAEKI